MFTISVITKNPSCSLKDPTVPDNAPIIEQYPYLPLKNLRTPAIPIKDLTGRNTGNNIRFNTRLNNSYDELKMRRKAEYLKYRGVTNAGYNLNNFSDVVKNRGRNIYSSATLRQVALNNTTINCNLPVTYTLPTNAGVVDNNSKGYYLSKDVDLFNSL
jgi:hypothetical protein